VDVIRVSVISAPPPDVVLITVLRAVPVRRDG
jgi:hypothetical protein